MLQEVPDFLEACGWQTMSDRIEVIRDFISKRVPRCDMLEVGSWVGHGAMNWRVEIGKLPEGGSLTCVDPWKPYHRAFELEHNGVCQVMHQALVDDEAYRLFRRNTSFGPQTAVPLHVHRGTLEEVAGRLPQFDIVFVDGSHYYEDVKKDLAIARTLVKPGGLLVGDDLEMQYEGNEAFVDAWSHVDCWMHVHPGVTKAVWETFGRVPEKNYVWWVQC